MRGIRRTAWIAAAAAVALSAAPATGASSPGSIAIASPASGQAIRRSAWVGWTWRTGSTVRSTRRVDVSVSRNGISWSAIARNAPIRWGRVAWNTTAFADAVYRVRVQVVGTTVRAIRTGITVDNTAPTVRLMSPKEGDVIVDGQNAATFAVVAGTAQLAALASDARSGVASVTWFLGDEQIASGSSAMFDFGTTPGRHVLTVVATDRAGNSSSDSISVLALPGPSTIVNAVPPADPSALPSIAPSEEPGAPGMPDAPDPDDVPGTPEVPALPETPSTPAPPSPPDGLTLPGLP